MKKLVKMSIFYIFAGWIWSKARLSLTQLEFDVCMRAVGAGFALEGVRIPCEGRGTEEMEEGGVPSSHTRGDGCDCVW